jgi:glycosyltransferase involved in cell wall biosynthesis
MKIGILGTRGIPNAYGGFEQFAQYLAQGLQQKGHEIFVYNSSDHPYQHNEWNGVHIVHCKDLESSIGTAGQFVYDFNCLRDAGKRSYDILLHLGYTSNSIWHRWWPATCPNIVNMDGLEWKRSKYNKWTQKFLKTAEALAAEYGDVLIADSMGIKDHIIKEYKRASIYIPYGAEIFENPDSSILAKWNLKAHEYFLLIARMEPENNIELIIKGYLQSTQLFPLILVGNSKNKYGKYLANTYSYPNIHFIGAIYDPEIIDNLRYFSQLYFHGHSVGGTNPSLLEAMGCSCLIAAHNNPFNKAILTDDAYYFERVDDVCNVINMNTDKNLKKTWINNNVEKIKSIYSWPKIIESYETVFMEALR